MDVILLITFVAGGAYEIPMVSKKACYDAVQRFNKTAHSMYGIDSPFMAVCIEGVGKR